MSATPNAPEISETPSTGHNQGPATVARFCIECGHEFHARAFGPGSKRKFCSDKHRKDWNNRNNAQGGPIIPLLKAWRIARNSPKNKDVGSWALSELVSIIDSMIQDDRAAGRSSDSMIDYVRDQKRSGYVYGDRRRD